MKNPSLGHIEPACLDESRGDMVKLPSIKRKAKTRILDVLYATKCRLINTWEINNIGIVK